MSDREIINPGTPVAGPYSPGIKVGNLLFISGQGSAQGAFRYRKHCCIFERYERFWKNE